jgi:hypothetical protein
MRSKANVNLSHDSATGSYSAMNAYIEDELEGTKVDLISLDENSTREVLINFSSDTAYACLSLY